VNNSLRHSGAGRIQVRLSVGHGAVDAIVEDDGCGFDVHEARQRARRGEHLGLLGMGERLRGVGGSVEMESTPGEGTKIQVRVPV
jgi:signal transduction histidine kinase